MSYSEAKDTAHYICDDSNAKFRANRRADLCMALVQNKGSLLGAFSAMFGLAEIADACAQTGNQQQQYTPAA